MDIEANIVSQMGFRPIIEDTPQTMDERIFRPDIMGLKADILEVRIEDRVVYDADQGILFLNFEKLLVDSLETIRAFEAHVQVTLANIGKRVDVIINYEGFDILPDLLDAYVAAAEGLQKAHFEKVTRYTTSDFMRLKLGDSLKQRGMSAHLYESPAEAGAALRRVRP